MPEQMNRQIDDMQNQVEQQYESPENTNHERQQIQNRLKTIDNLQDKIMNSDLSKDHKKDLLQKTLNIVQNVIHKDLEKHPTISKAQIYQEPIQLRPDGEPLDISADQREADRREAHKEAYEYEDYQGVAVAPYVTTEFEFNGQQYGGETVYPEGVTERQKQGIYERPVVVEEFNEDLKGPERELVLKQNEFHKAIDDIVEQVDLPMNTVIENLDGILNPENESAMPQEYTVVRGDSLSKIASQCVNVVTGDKLSWRNLQKQNNIKNANQIRIGQKIKIPEGYQMDGAQVAVMSDHSPSLQKALQIIGTRQNFTLGADEHFKTYDSDNNLIETKPQGEVLVDEMVDEGLRDDVLTENRKYERYMDPDEDAETPDEYGDIIGDIDGLMGNKSRAAVMAFQLNYNDELMERAYAGEDIKADDFLPIDGIVNKKTLQKIVNTLKEHTGIDEPEPPIGGGVVCRNGEYFRQVTREAEGVYPGPPPLEIEEIPMKKEEVIKYKAEKSVTHLQNRIKFADMSAFDDLVVNGKFRSYSSAPKAWNRAFQRALRKRISGNEADAIQQLIGTPGDWKPGPHTLYKLMQAQGIDPSTDSRFNQDYIARWEQKTDKDIRKGNNLLKAEIDGTNDIDEFAGEEGVGQEAIQKVIDEKKSKKQDIGRN